METYRMINRELSINNQELRNVINKLKHEVTYLNRQLLEQREEFNRLKDSIAKTIEKKYIETIALIFPDKISDEKQQSKLDMVSHRRSCSNVTAADPIKNRSHSPPAGSSSCVSAIMEDSMFKRPIPSIVVEGSGRLSKSPCKSLHSDSNQSQSRKSEDLQNSKNCTQDPNGSQNSEMELTLRASNASLVTINEEKSVGGLDVPNETISDDTLNCLLDAPCSTPYHHPRESNETHFQPKNLRILVKRISEEKLAQLSIQKNHYSQYSASRLRNTSFKSKSAQIEACHSEWKYSQLKLSHITMNNSSSDVESINDSEWKYSPNSSSDGNFFAKVPKNINSKEIGVLKGKSRKLSESCLTTTNNSECKYNKNSSLDEESFPTSKKSNKIQTEANKIPTEDKPIKMSKGKKNEENSDTDSGVKKLKKNRKGNWNKKNSDTDSDARCKEKKNKENADTDSDVKRSDEDSNVEGTRLRRNKLISLKEPNLRKKLRNTTNIKL